MKIKKVVQFEVESTKGAKITDENVGDYVVLIGGIMTAKMPTEETGICGGGIMGNSHAIDWVMDGYNKTVEERIMFGDGTPTPEPQSMYTPSEMLEIVLGTLTQTGFGLSEDELLRCFDVIYNKAPLVTRRTIRDRLSVIPSNETSRCPFEGDLK